MKDLNKLSKKEKKLLGWAGTIFAQMMMLLLATYIFIFENNNVHPAGWMIVGFLLCTIMIDWHDSKN